MNNLWSLLKEVTSYGGHDLTHVRRVHRMCMKLAEGHPEADHEILTAAVILHDIARDAEDNDKAHLIDHAVLGAQQAEEILLNMGWPPERAEHVKACIETHRYRSQDKAPQSIEAKLLYDADKLDSIGLIGVARVYMLAGQYGEQFHVDMTAEQKKLNHAPHVHDFEQYSANIEYYVKMRHIPEKLITEEAKRVAKVRMAKMDAFFEGLEDELELRDLKEENT